MMQAAIGTYFLNNERYDKILREMKEARILRKNNRPLIAKHYRRLTSLPIYWLKIHVT
jgi:hypothetical protein